MRCGSVTVVTVVWHGVALEDVGSLRAGDDAGCRPFTNEVRYCTEENERRACGSGKIANKPRAGNGKRQTPSAHENFQHLAWRPPRASPGRRIAKSEDGAGGWDGRGMRKPDRTLNAPIPRPLSSLMRVERIGATGLTIGTSSNGGLAALLGALPVVSVLRLRPLQSGCHRR